MNLAATLRGTTYRFRDLKDVLAKANEEKSGDRLAGLAAANVSERVAAKRVLAEVTLAELHENPVVPPESDAVTRLILDDLQRPIYDAVKSWTVAELREHVLADTTSGAELLRLSRGLSSEMIAACAKLMTNMDLVYAARKIRVVVHATNTVGLAGRLSVRLQPNHPSDSIEGIMASLREGLSYGAGDAVFGINPVTDDPETTAAILNATGDFMRQWRIPTQNCCLAHVTTQMKALESGAQLGLMFQSIAGTEKALRSFGVTLPLLDEAYDMTLKLGQCQGPNVMYFETGQGSALSADAHEGADQMTLEARNYGLARHYAPFLVNTVVGFIGPEYLYDARQITRAGLEDHFMGKLHGISMGCDACYTNHADADQNDVENLEMLLTTAGCNFFMGLPMGDDIMLNYQSTSFHDNATLRQLFGLRPAPEFEAWLEEMDIMRDGKLTARAGDPSLFGVIMKDAPMPKPTIDRSRVEALVREALARQMGAGSESPGLREVESAGALLIPPDRGVGVGEPYDPRVMPAFLKSTPARIAVGRTGPRYKTNTMLRFRADHAAAKDAVVSEVDPALLSELGMFELASRAPDKPTFLQRPDLGRALSDEARAELTKRIAESPTLIVIYGDGLSAAAINQHLRAFHGALVPALAARGIAHAPAFFVRRSRVKIMDEIARLVGAQAALFVCGERPGLGFADSLSAYYIYQPAAGATDADREVISNINPRGRPPADAARDVAAAVERILRQKKSGVVLGGG